MVTWFRKRNNGIKGNQLYCVEKCSPRDLGKSFGMAQVRCGWLWFTCPDYDQLVEIELTGWK